MPGLFGRAPSHDVEGIVTRVGPWLGPGKANGIVLALEGHARPYVLVRDDQVCKYPAGLTQPGDRVSMRVRPAPEFYAVQLSDFRNHTLENTMRFLAKDRPTATSAESAPPDVRDETDETPVAAVTHMRSLRLVVQNADS